MTRYLIAGAAGQLGTDLRKALAGRDVTALTRADLDVTDRDAVLAAVAGHDAVINASASAYPRNRTRKTSAVLRKLSLKAAKNWHQNSGANRRESSSGVPVASMPSG